MAWTGASVGVARSAMGQAERGMQSYREALEWAAASANRLIQMQAPLWLAVRAPSDQRPFLYTEVLHRLYADRHWLDLWVAIESLAAHWALTGRPAQAAVLLGHLDSRGRGHGAMVRRRARISGVLSATQPDYMAQGAAMDREELVRFALDELAREVAED
jgi:hypothetical protein